jgi:uncharacterized protein
LIRALFGILIVFVFSSSVNAELAVPPITGNVLDQTATLTVDQQRELTQTLQLFEQKKGSQIAILMVPSTEGEAIEQYALRVVEKWQPGRAKVDDGVLILVAKQDRAVRIEVGYGLEGALNDATAKRIIAEMIAPHFRQNDFFGGLAAGVNQVMQVIEGEPLPPPVNQSRGTESPLQKYFPLILLGALLVGAGLQSVLGRLWGSLATGGLFLVITWFIAGTIIVAVLTGLFAVLISLFSGSTVGLLLIGSFMGGRGGMGGGGGFGGGGFGGGGASGRW